MEVNEPKAKSEAGSYQVKCGPIDPATQFLVMSLGDGGMLSLFSPDPDGPDAAFHIVGNQAIVHNGRFERITPDIIGRVNRRLYAALARDLEMRADFEIRSASSRIESALRDEIERKEKAGEDPKGISHTVAKAELDKIMEGLGERFAECLLRTLAEGGAK